jgi:hypothetical protein
MHLIEVGNHGPIRRTILLVAALLERAGAHRLVTVSLIEDGRKGMAISDGISTLDIGATRPVGSRIRSAPFILVGPPH